MGFIYRILIVALLVVLGGCQTLQNGLNSMNTRTVHQSEQGLSSIERYDVKRVAIFIPEHSNGKVNNRRLQVEGIFLGGLLEKGYQVVTRNDLPIVFEEWERSRTALSEGNIHKFGSMLNVDAVLMPQITVYEEAKTSDGKPYISKLHMTTRLIKIDNGATIWSATKAFEPNLLNVALFPIWMMKGGYNKYEALSLETLKSFPRLGWTAQ